MESPHCVVGAGGPFLLRRWRVEHGVPQHTHSHGPGGDPPPAELVHSARVMGHGGPESKGKEAGFFPETGLCQSVSALARSKLFFGNP